MFRRVVSGLCALLCLFAISSSLATDDEEEVSLADAPVVPYVYILSPKTGASYESGNKLTVQGSGRNTQRITVELKLADETLQWETSETEFSHVFFFETPQTVTATLTLRGYAGDDDSSTCAVATTVIASPKDELIQRMISLAYANSKDSRYKFAPAESDSDIGVCKNFVMRLFDTYSKEYRMLAYPDLALHMPKNNSKKACAPYDYGIEWRPETAEDGSPFEIVAQFKYDDSLTEEQNAELARNLLVQIQKGDFFQIVGYYGGGNGPHSMYIIADYDPVTEMIHWTDSNMKGKRVNGVRWGYMQYDADADVEWWVKVFNMKKRGATLYRLRDDLFKP